MYGNQSFKHTYERENYYKVRSDLGSTKPTQCIAEVALGNSSGGLNVKVNEAQLGNPIHSHPVVLTGERQ